MSKPVVLFRHDAARHARFMGLFDRLFGGI
jgi:hypothetical protein